MKQGFRRRRLSVAVIGLLALLLPILAACNGAPATADTNTAASSAPVASTGGTASEATSSASSAASGAAGSTGSIPRFDQPVALEIFTRVNSPETSTPPADWFWVKAVKDALNIDVKVNFVTETSQYNNLLQTRAAANELPDLFQTEAIVQNQLVSQGLVADWEPLLQSMPNYVNDRNVEALKSVGTFDGKLYGLVTQSAFPYKTITVVRKDWLDKLGLQVPKTLDEYFAVMQAFTTKDPDGNGQADTYGFSAAIGSQGEITNIDPILGAFDSLGVWRVQDGKLVATATSANRRQALEFLSKMNQAGVIDPDWKAQKPEDFRLKWKAGKIGIFTEDWCAALCPQNYAQFAQANPQGVLQIIDPPTGPNGASGAGVYSTAGQMYGLSQKAVDAGKGEAAARLLEWINGPGYRMTLFGEEGAGKGYTLDANGNVTNVNNDQAYIVFRQLTSWGIKGGNDEWQIRYGQQTKQGDGSTLDVFKDVLQRAAQLPKTDTTQFAPLPPVPAEVSGDYTRTVNEGAFQFASGARPFSEWDAYVQSVNGVGLDAWTAAATQRAQEVGILK